MKAFSEGSERELVEKAVRLRGCMGYPCRLGAVRQQYARV